MVLVAIEQLVSVTQYFADQIQPGFTQVYNINFAMHLT